MEDSRRTPRRRAPLTSRVREGGGGGLALGLCLLGLIVTADVILDSEAAAIVGSYVAAPFVTAIVGGPRATAVVAMVALALAIASPTWNMNTGGADQAVRIALVGAGGLVAVAGSYYQLRSRGRSERLRLLDAVGAVADGSLPLSETLNRVTEVIVPAVGDVCMVDAVRDGRVNRIATRVRGSGNDEAIEERLRRRPPTLPRWLVEGERSWRHIPRWVAKVSDEEVRRMAHSPEDLEFLRSLGIKSSVVVPIRARNRNLGTLSLLTTAWSGRRYTEDDVRFAQILSGRMGLALDNAGLFSDLESVERRMDSVMSILDEAVVIHGADGELVFANPAAARVLGYSDAEEAIDAPAAELELRFAIRDEGGVELGPEALRGEPARPGEPERSRTLRVTTRSTGRERWYRTKTRGIEGADHELLYSVTAIEDVTDVMRAEFANRLLARTGELLSHSVDYRATIERIPQLLVPDFADSCTVELQQPSADPVPEPPAEPARVLHAPEIAAGVGPDELRRVDAESAIVAPMSAGGVTVGALTFVNRRGSRTFDDHDVAIATEVARRAGLAIENARIADERARVAEALQRELLPPSLPRMPGWQVATMYEPAGEINEVGGDFYEVFPVEGGWAVVLGDVSGKGAAAAALTAEARHTIRTAGSLSEDPCSGLYVLNRNLCARADAALCSVALLVLPEAGSADEVLVYLAGHPHPIALRNGGAEEVGAPGPMLGVSSSPAWGSVAVPLAAGEQLVVYTDGVIEAKRSGGERFGTDRLRTGLQGSEGPDSVVERVRAALAGFGSGRRDDDAALVAIQRDPAAGAPGLTARSTSEAIRTPSLG